MIALLDTSVLLRKLLGEPSPLREWKTIRTAYASRILQVELGRVVDRLRLAGQIDDQRVADLQEESRRVLASILIVPITERILERAQGAMPTTLGTLDAIHLATAVEISSALGAPLTVATHDLQLLRAARAFGLPTCGA